jgi:hypothetical protein
MVAVPSAMTVVFSRIRFRQRLDDGLRHWNGGTCCGSGVGIPQYFN